MNLDPKDPVYWIKIKLPLPLTIERNKQMLKVFKEKLKELKKKKKTRAGTR